ncbi:MAG: ATP-binding protein [Pseudomonadota bacterium]
MLKVDAEDSSKDLSGDLSEEAAKQTAKEAAKGASKEPASSGRGLFPRIAWAVVLGFIALHVAGFYFYGHERLVENARSFAISTAVRAVSIDELLTRQPDLLPVLQHESFQITRLKTAQQYAALNELSRWPHNGEILSAVQQHLSNMGVPDAEQIKVLYTTRPGPPRLILGLPSRAGGWLQITAQTHVTNAVNRTRSGTFMTLVLVCVIGLILFVTRRSTRQLERFSLAAEQLGDGQLGEPLPEKVGARELRRASRAFNRMQAKVMDLLDQRTQMLAGVSHDLRTLTTRLGLRLEYIDDERQQAKAQTDIELMTDILDQALTYARDEHSDENFTPLDISSLLQTLVHTLQDQSYRVEFSGPDHLVLPAQRLAVTRLFENLLDNALKYGGAAQVQLTTGGAVIVDPGVGFSHAEATAATRPYVRLQAARSQDQPGSGLGLAIVDNVCRRHDWTLRFEQLTEGFAVHLEFNER